MKQRKIRLVGKKLSFIIFQICATVFTRGKKKKRYLAQADEINSHTLTEGKEGAQTVLAIMHFQVSIFRHNCEIYVKINKYNFKLKDVWKVHLCVLSCRHDNHKYKDQLILFWQYAH